MLPIQSAENKRNATKQFLIKQRKIDVIYAHKMIRYVSFTNDRSTCLRWNTLHRHIKSVYKNIIELISSNFQRKKKKQEIISVIVVDMIFFVSLLIHWPCWTWTTWATNDGWYNRNRRHTASIVPIQSIQYIQKIKVNFRTFFSRIKHKFFPKIRRTRRYIVITHAYLLFIWIRLIHTTQSSM